MPHEVCRLEPCFGSAQRLFRMFNIGEDAGTG